MEEILVLDFDVPVLMISQLVSDFMLRFGQSCRNECNVESEENT